MTLPATLDALLDTRLRRQDLRVYGALLREADPLAYRPIKLASLARATGMSGPHVWRSLRHLIRFGYLERGPREGPIRTYRPLPTRLTSPKG